MDFDIVDAARGLAKHLAYCISEQKASQQWYERNEEIVKVLCVPISRILPMVIGSDCFQGEIDYRSEIPDFAIDGIHLPDQFARHAFVWLLGAEACRHLQYISMHVKEIPSAQSKWPSLAAHADDSSLEDVWRKIADYIFELRTLANFLEHQRLNYSPSVLQIASDKPSWNRNSGTLTLNGKLVKQVTKMGLAKNAVPVLDAFEEEAWPDRIDDPTSTGNSEKLRNTVRSLNANCNGITFEADGTGTGFRWRSE